MAIDYLARAYNEIRRKDREIADEEWMREFLKRSAIGTLATQWQGQPFINSNIFVYDENRHAIYLHTAKTGRTRSNLAEEEKVCFSISEMGRLLPAEEAMHFSVEYAGVTIFGRGQVVEDDREATEGLQLLLDKYFPHLRPEKDYRPVVAKELKLTAVYRIYIDSWSGKQKKVAEDFPGAFFYESKEWFE